VHLFTSASAPSQNSDLDSGNGVHLFTSAS